MPLADWQPDDFIPPHKTIRYPANPYWWDEGPAIEIIVCPASGRYTRPQG